MKKRSVFIMTCICMSAIIIFTFYLVKKRQDWAILENKAGLEYLKEGRTEDAINSFNNVLTKYNDVSAQWIRAKFLKGMAYELEGRYNESLKAFKEILVKCPKMPYLAHLDSASVETEIGIIYHRLGEKKEAVRTWMDVVEKYPNSRSAVIANYLLGKLTDEQFRIQISRKQISGMYFSYLEYLAGFKSQMDGKSEEAKSYYQKCIELSGGRGVGYQQAKKELEKLRFANKKDILKKTFEN